MRKVLLVIIALIVLCTNKVIASDFSRYSDDSKIISALAVLDNVGSNDVFTRLDKMSTKIMFYDLTLIDFSYAKHYAISSTDNYGNNYILINEKFRNSPNESIACLIAHESVHVLPQATLDEEVRATTKEAQTWIKVKDSANPEISNDLINRLNKLAVMYRASTPEQNLIRESIAGNSFYQKQLAMR